MVKWTIIYTPGKKKRRGQWDGAHIHPPEGEDLEVQEALSQLRARARPLTVAKRHARALEKRFPGRRFTFVKADGGWYVTEVDERGVYA